jgi:hypothetical protein
MNETGYLRQIRPELVRKIVRPGQRDTVDTRSLDFDDAPSEWIRESRGTRPRPRTFVVAASATSRARLVRVVDLPPAR